MVEQSREEGFMVEVAEGLVADALDLIVTLVAVADIANLGNDVVGRFATLKLTIPI